MSERIFDVAPGNVAFLWSQIRPHIERALDRDGSGRYLPDDVLRFAVKGTVQIWIAWNPETHEIDAAIVTEIINYPRLRELRLWLIGGSNMKAWVREAIDTLEAFGRAHNCVYAIGGMRKGWMRIGQGYRQTGVTFEKVW